MGDLIDRQVGRMSDLIERQAVIDEVHKNYDTILDFKSDGRTVADSFEDIINALPSAQPEKRTEERTETHSCDLISRQAAIDAILAVTGNSSVRELYEHVQEHGLSDMWSGGVNAAIDIIIAVPSAQPKRNTGHWEITEAYPHNVYCSNCHRIFAQTHWTVWEDGSLSRNFCPNCGSYNGGEQDED